MFCRVGTSSWPDKPRRAFRPPRPARRGTLVGGFVGIDAPALGHAAHVRWLRGNAAIVASRRNNLLGLSLLEWEAEVVVMDRDRRVRWQETVTGAVGLPMDGALDLKPRARLSATGFWVMNWMTVFRHLTRPPQRNPPPRNRRLQNREGQAIRIR